MSSDPLQIKRHRMVQHQIEARGVSDRRVLDAMRQVPRERFIPEFLADLAYEDLPLPIEEDQTISQPFIVAFMIDALHLGANDRALEIGAGSGYAAAVLSHVARVVYAIERDPTLAHHVRERMTRMGYDNVRILCGDGTLGWPEHAPFDAILVSAGGPAIPESLLRQLTIGGRMIMPVGAKRESQQLIQVHRTGEHTYHEHSLGRVHFVPLVGTEGWSRGRRAAGA